MKGSGKILDFVCPFCKSKNITKIKIQDKDVWFKCSECGWFHLHDLI